MWHSHGCRGTPWKKIYTMLFGLEHPKPWGKKYFLFNSQMPQVFFYSNWVIWYQWPYMLGNNHMPLHIWKNWGKERWSSLSKSCTWLVDEHLVPNRKNYFKKSSIQALLFPFKMKHTLHQNIGHMLFRILSSNHVYLFLSECSFYFLSVCFYFLILCFCVLWLSLWKIFLHFLYPSIPIYLFIFLRNLYSRYTNFMHFLNIILGT